MRDRVPSHLLVWKLFWFHGDSSRSVVQTRFDLKRHVRAFGRVAEYGARSVTRNVAVERAHLPFLSGTAQGQFPLKRKPTPFRGTFRGTTRAPFRGTNRASFRGTFRVSFRAPFRATLSVTNRGAGLRVSPVHGGAGSVPSTWPLSRQNARHVVEGLGLDDCPPTVHGQKTCKLATVELRAPLRCSRSKVLP